MHYKGRVTGGKILTFRLLLPEGYHTLSLTQMNSVRTADYRRPAAMLRNAGAAGRENCGGLRPALYLRSGKTGVLAISAI